MKRIILLLSLVIVAVSMMLAQTVSWVIKPGVYSKIEPCWDNMYIVYKGGNVGVIDSDGKVIVAPSASRITGFYAGFALVLKAEGGQERILGILSTDGSYAKVTGNYYTIPAQEFFSEGLLTIVNARGQAGFMNANGVIEKVFEDTFVSPFSEGFATVGEGEDFRIVNRRFNELSIQLGTVSQVYGGSGVYQGIAIIWDGNGKVYDYDVTQGTCVPVKGSRKSLINLNNIQWDYLGCFATITNRSGTVPYESVQRPSVTLSASMENGKYGYTRDGNSIVPFQFEQAEDFYGSLAIVSIRGAYGLLGLKTSDDAFKVVANNPTISYKKDKDKDLSHKFTLSVPDSWNMEDINVRVTNQDGAELPVVQEGTVYEFKADGGKELQIYSVDVNSGNLKLWKGNLSYNYTPITEVIVVDEVKTNDKPLNLTLKAGNTHADNKDRCYVTATVVNPNPNPVTATVRMSGTDLLTPVSQRITIPAHGSQKVSTYFTVKKAVSAQKVTATTTAGGSATLDGLQLIPY